jgi:serine/threonine protein kinase
MSFTAGMRLGPYEIVSPLGAGGMGEVYRARDTRLGREVAVKVLPADLVHDSERLQRFEREARAAGILSHPNILVIYDVGTHEGNPYVVSELLEGATLRDVMGSAPLPPSKAIAYALQIAKGLAAAHAKGIVHRDLKPENLFVTQDGHVKILDFGLAKLIQMDDPQVAVSQAVTRTVATQDGRIIGTFGYMSPEQLRGQPADHRSDIFSFGIVLYEMLAGIAPFQRPSTADTMSAVLREDAPELASSGRSLPLALDRIVRHCLEKRPEDRFNSAQDIAFAVESLSGLREGEAPTAGAPASSSSKKRATRISKIARIQPAAIASYRQLTFRRGTVFSARFAPDGRTIVYSAAWDGEVVEVFSTRAEFPESRSLGFRGAQLYSISSTGELAIALKSRYISHRQLRGTLARVPLEGAAPRPTLEGVHEAEWTPDGKAFAVVREVDGRFRLEMPVGNVLYETSGWISHLRVHSKGAQIAFLDHPFQGDDRGSVALIDLAGEKKVLSEGWAGAAGLAWSADESEVWFTAAEAGLARGLHAVTLYGRKRLVTRMAGGLILTDIAKDGRMLVIRDVERSEIMGRIGDGPKEKNLSYLDLSVVIDLSDDGNTILFMEQGVASGSTYAVCVRGTDGSPVLRLGEGAASGLSPDGEWALAIVYGTPPQLVLLPTGAGDPRPLPRHDIEGYVAARWVPDGRRIIFVGHRPGESPRCYVQDLDGGEPRPITDEDVAIRGLPVSPDGRFVACTGSDGTMRLVPVEGGESRTVPGVSPGEVLIRWGHDGGSLFVYAPGQLPARIHRVNVDSGQRTLLMELIPSDPAGVSTIGQIRLTPDGKSCAYSFKRILSELYLVEGLA